MYTQPQGSLCPGQTETGRLGHPLLQGVETEQQKAVHPNSAQGNKEVLLGQIQAKGGGHLEFFVGVHFSSSVMSCTEKEPVLMCLIISVLVFYYLCRDTMTKATHREGLLTVSKTWSIIIMGGSMVVHSQTQC